MNARRVRRQDRAEHVGLTLVTDEPPLLADPALIEDREVRDQADGRLLGSAYMEPHSLICARLYAPGQERALDAALGWLAARQGDDGAWELSEGGGAMLQKVRQQGRFRIEESQLIPLGFTYNLTGPIRRKREVRFPAYGMDLPTGNKIQTRVDK